MVSPSRGASRSSMMTVSVHVQSWWPRVLNQQGTEVHAQHSSKDRVVTVDDSRLEPGVGGKTEPWEMCAPLLLTMCTLIGSAKWCIRLGLSL